MKSLEVTSQEREWQSELTTRLFRMQHALGSKGVEGANVGNHHEGRAAEQIADWLHSESQQNAGGRSLRIDLGRGAVLSSLRENTTPGDFERGFYTPEPLAPLDDAKEMTVDRCALVSLASIEEAGPSVAYYLRDADSRNWISVRDIGESILGAVSFVNSAPRQEAVEAQTGAQYVPDFTGEFEAVGAKRD